MKNIFYILLGILLSMVLLYFAMPKTMINKTKSPYSFDTTISKITENVKAEKWSLMGIKLRSGGVFCLLSSFCIFQLNKKPSNMETLTIAPFFSNWSQRTNYKRKRTVCSRYSKALRTFLTRRYSTTNSQQGR